MKKSEKQIDINNLLGGVTKTEKKNSKIPVISSNVSDEITKYVILDRQSKDLKAKMDILKEKIVGSAKNEYEKSQGKVTSFKLNGNEKEVATVSFKNQFKKLDFNPEYANLKGFEDLFEETREIKFKNPDDKTIVYLAEKLGVEKFQELFETTRKYSGKEDLNEKQFTASQELKQLIQQTISLSCK